MNKKDEAIKAAAGKVSEALRAMLEDDGDFETNANEVCSALETMTETIGVTSLSLRQLRREMKKRGYND